MIKSELKELIKTHLGYPMVKVELSDSQLDVAINKARSEYIKWAIGNVTQEVFITMMLSGGQSNYELPSGVTEVISMTDLASSGVGGINTLFTIENYLYNKGMLGFLEHGGFSIIDYHLALDYLNTLDKYTADKYMWHYHRYNNILSLNPTPPNDEVMTIETSGGEITVNSPGWIMLKTYMLEGSILSNNPDSLNEFLYEETWIQDYSLAICKMILGETRRKFANFSSIGNTGISLDGDSLLSEGKEEKERLEEKLKEEENFEGSYITFG